MKELYIKELSLTNYRNFASFNIKTENRPIVLIGKNGCGKTNILEAISLILIMCVIINHAFLGMTIRPDAWWDL